MALFLACSIKPVACGGMESKKTYNFLESYAHFHSINEIEAAASCYPRVVERLELPDVDRPFQTMDGDAYLELQEWL